MRPAGIQRVNVKSQGVLEVLYQQLRVLKLQTNGNYPQTPVV